MNITLENETVPATLTLTLPSPLQILTVWRPESYLPRDKFAEDSPATWPHQQEQKGLTKHSTFKGSCLQMCPPQVPRLHTRCDPLGVDGWERLERTAADDEVISTIWGMDEFTGERGKKKHVTFLFSRLKSLSFRVQEGIVALTLFFGRRVAACQRQLHMGSFTLHAASGFRGKLFLFLDHLPL